MAFQTSSSDLGCGISSVHAGAAVSSVCFIPCRLLLLATGDTGGSAVLASCLGKMASAAGVIIVSEWGLRLGIWIAIVPCGTSLGYRP